MYFSSCYFFSEATTIFCYLCTSRDFEKLGSHKEKSEVKRNRILMPILKPTYICAFSAEKSEKIEFENTIWNQ